MGIRVLPIFGPLAPNPVTAGLVIGTGLVWGGAELVDHWDDDWERLWWVRLDGHAEIRTIDPNAIAALAAKYQEYANRPPRGPVIRIRLERTARWDASG